ncbi:hypothetical protein EDE15_2163 [Edaphobacter aggregans]|uniref:LVIVD repeat-containing protein n=1 Tax=Edaphobacter aggregans TaxID=570835 RepID=A0A3R9QHD1_9BACT|nr:hypothetical protein [Edaphobacter aggregans]RSL16642.1 hypothetical protein EDE15_2163 [Edaphobacter aggregans]
MNQIHTAAKSVAIFSLCALAASIPSNAQDGRFDRDHDFFFYPGNLVVSRSVYDNNPNNVKVGTILPPNCASTTGGCSAATGAPYNGAYPTVFNNDIYDANFGVTSAIFLDQITPFGWRINTLEVPNSSQRGIKSSSDQLVTSFSSKSEIALNLSTDGRILTFMGYVSPIDAIDVSNSSTPAAVDPTDPVGLNTYRAVATVDSTGRFTFTETNAYSGNNGRAAILNDTDGANVIYTAGNAGNGSNPQPNGIVLGAGAQFIEPATVPESFQTPTTPTPLSSFSVTLLGDKADKVGKDDNFRGLTIFNDVVYFTKGSGSNGVNTVYFVDTTGTACPKGVGIPAVGAKLPISPLTYDPTKLQTTGLPSNMCILAGFPTVLAKNANPAAAPFGIWFANADTLYVADEGDGYTGGTDLYTHAAAQTTAGLQKWVFNSTTSTWSLAYTLQTGLGLGTSYTVHNYPTGNNPATNLPWAPATDGLRNLTGHVDRDGHVTIWAITSTISGNGDVGADPNRLVAIRDLVQNSDPTVAAKESFYTLRQADYAEVLRGVSFTPGTDVAHDRHDFDHGYHH